MTIKTLKLPYLTKMLTTAVLSTSLLISGCSNNDVDEVGADQSTIDSDNTATSKKPTPAVATVDNTEQEENVAKADAVADTTTLAEVTNPALTTSESPSLVTNPTQAGTPEDTVKQALNTLYYGDVKKAATYYKVDMANFEQELANTQSAFQQTVEGVTITDTTYNDDKTRATIEGELMLKGQKEPAPLTYELQKINGKWKILG